MTCESRVYTAAREGEGLGAVEREKNGGTEKDRKQAEEGEEQMASHAVTRDIDTHARTKQSFHSIKHTAGTIP